MINFPIISLLNLYNVNDFFIPILVLTTMLEITSGHFFLLMLLFINQNLKFDQEKSIYFLMGVFLISVLPLIKKISTKALLGLFLGMIYFSIDNTSDTRKAELKKAYLIGVSLATLLFLWTEYEKAPKLKYVKLFYRK
jgi:hypothetical protein